MLVGREAVVAAQPAPVGAQPGQIQVPAERRCGAGSAARVGGARIRAGLIGQRPRHLQPVLAGPFDAVVFLLGEELRLDAQVAPQLVEQHVHELRAGLRFRAGQRLAERGPLGVVGGELVDSVVGQSQLAGLLQVGHRDAPAALEIGPQPIGDDVAQRAGDLLARDGFVRGVLVFGEVLQIAAERRDDARPQRLIGERLVGVSLVLLAGRPVQRRAHQADQHEVVEMAGLQAGVLAVVGEGQELAGVVVEVRCGPQRPHHRLRQHRHRAGAALGAQAGHPGELRLLRAFVAGLTRRAEVQPLEERDRQAVVGDGAELVDPESGGQPVAAGLIEAAARGVGDHPVVGDQVQQRWLVESRPRPFGEEQQPGGRGLLAAGVVEHPWTEALPPAVEVDHQEVLAAFAAECQRKQRPARGSLRGAALVLRCQVTGSGWLQGHVDGVALADELVQFEREQRPALVVAGLGAGRQQVAQPVLTGVFVDAGLVGQRLGGGVQPGRHLTALVSLVVFAQPEGLLGPDGQRVGAQLLPAARGRGVEPCGQCCRIGVALGGATQRLPDDVLRRDRRAEDPGGQLGHLPALLGLRPGAGQGGAGADALQRPPCRPHPATAGPASRHRRPAVPGRCAARRGPERTGWPRW